MKQTAVKWLVQTLNENIDFIPLDKWDEIRDVVQQALAMEKEQMIEFGYDILIQADENQNGYVNIEQYYNETYKKE